MPLFDGRHLSREHLEDRLKRRLDGDPTRGEVAVLLAINRDDLVTARRHRKGEDIGGDFRLLVESHMRRPVPRDGALKYISVGLPQQTWDEYARKATGPADVPASVGRRPSNATVRLVWKR